MPTYAPLQLLVDELTVIDPIKRCEFLLVEYNLTRLSRLPKLLRNYEPEQDPPEGILADVMAIPVQDLGQNETEKSPWKIKLMDDSESPITQSPWLCGEKTGLMTTLLMKLWENPYWFETELFLNLPIIRTEKWKFEKIWTRFESIFRTISDLSIMPRNCQNGTKIVKTEESKLIPTIV